MYVKHVRRPWKVLRYVRRGGKRYCNRRISYEGPTGAVRHIGDAAGDIGPPEVTDANACLMAAAPDLKVVAAKWIVQAAVLSNYDSMVVPKDIAEWALEILENEKHQNVWIETRLVIEKLSGVGIIEM